MTCANGSPAWLCAARSPIVNAGCPDSRRTTSAPAYPEAPATATVNPFALMCIFIHSIAHETNPDSQCDRERPPRTYTCDGGHQRFSVCGCAPDLPELAELHAWHRVRGSPGAYPSQ